MSGRGSEVICYTTAMTFKIRGHRVIATKQTKNRLRDRKEAVQSIIGRQEEETGDCYGHWGGFGIGPITVAVQVNTKGLA